MGASRKKPDPKIVPPRPDDVPDAARWNAHEETWGDGDLVEGKRHGRWTFYFAEGGVAGHATYLNGVREGVAEWFHKNKSGDLRERITYVAGKIHGKRVWQRTRKGKVPGFEWFEKLGESTWRYEVPHVNGTGQPRWTTHYGRAGMDEQVPTTAEGRSIRLGDHMDKLAPQTVLMLLEESFIDSADREVHDGSLARIGRGAKTPRGRYVYVGREAEDVFHLQFVYDDSPVAAEYFVDGNELSRAFTLAADYYLTARPVFDTPRKR
jgi:hypothetical protein